MIQNIGVNHEFIRASRVLFGPTVITDDIAIFDIAFLKDLMRGVIEPETMGRQMRDWVVTVCNSVLVGLFQVLVEPLTELGVPYPWRSIGIEKFNIDILVFQADGCVGCQGSS